MGEPEQVTIVDTRDAPSIREGRGGKMDRIVVYAADPTHVYSVILPVESFSEDALRAAIRADLAERRQWQLRPFRL